MRRCASPPLSRRCGARIGGAGFRPARRHGRRPRAAPAPSASATGSAGWRPAARPTSSCSISTIRTGCRSTIRSISWCTARIGTAVASVMIGGRLVVDNRRVVGIDLARLRQRAEAARERLAAANADNRRLYEALEPVVGSHCPAPRPCPLPHPPLRRAARRLIARQPHPPLSARPHPEACGLNTASPRRMSTASVNCSSFAAPISPVATEGPGRASGAAAAAPELG